MKKSVKTALIAAGAPVGVVAVLFTIYFFNLDMKAMTLVDPFLQKHYDNMSRKQYV